jgi:hypothetical protein
MEKGRRIFTVCVLIALAGAGSISCSHLEKKVESPVIEDGTLVLRFKDPSARTVQIAADWNNWAQGDAEQGEVLVGLMDKDDRTGIWEARVTLRAGRYRYLFLVNELHWVLDPDNPRVVDDGRGGKANLVIMP